MATTLRIHLRNITDRSYDLVIGTSLSGAAKDIKKSFSDTKKFVITDNHVGRLYGANFIRALGETSDHLLIIQAGEQSKNRTTKRLLENKLLSLHAERNSLILALGGGMIGDLAGFVAATLHRGVPFIQIPTTLLAQVDSSIGGKVAVDHPLGKNLIGAFYQPQAVFIDIKTLSTLSDKEFFNGMAEVIKYGAILDAKFFSFLEQRHSAIVRRNKTTLLTIVKRCCELKRTVVERDERETSYRRILNFGHTLGHAIESLSQYRLAHGEAIAIGMMLEARLSENAGLISHRSVERLERLLHCFHLPTSAPKRMNPQRIIQATLKDKKVIGGEVYYTLLEKIGKARVGVNISTTEVLRMLGE